MLIATKLQTANNMASDGGKLKYGDVTERLNNKKLFL
jgi:hypothetical protein